MGSASTNKPIQPNKPGRPQLPEGVRRVQIGARVSPGTLDILKSYGTHLGRAIDMIASNTAVEKPANAD